MKTSPPDLLVENAPLETAATIIREAAEWLIRQNQPLWKIDDLALDQLRNRCQPDEIFVGSVNGQPAVAAFIQSSDRFLWPDDQQAHYIHKLSVRRSFAGQGLPAQLLKWAGHRAANSGKKFLRLDCAADRPKLRAFYEQQGFGYVDTRHFGPLEVALYQQSLST